MKKILCILLSITLLSSFVTVNAQISSNITPSDAEQSQVEALIPCDATLEDDFSTNRLLLTIKTSHSEVNKVWSASDFPEINNIVSIDDLTFAESQKMYDKRSSNPEFSQILSFTLSSTTKHEILECVEALEENDKILSVDPDYLVEQVDPVVSEQSVSTYANLSLNEFDRYKKYTSDTYLLEQEGLFLHNVDKVWNAFTTGSNSVTVGVLDGGIYAHADLNGNLITGYDCVSQTNGVSSSYADSHGTVVASIIGAVGDNSIGVSGVCQDVSIKSFTTSHSPDSGGVSMNAMLNGINKAANLDIPILNVSVNMNDERYYSVIQDYDGLVVCSAGNKQSEFNENYDGFSSAYTLDNVLVVGAIDSNKQKDQYSNYSAEYVDVMAFGGPVTACKKGGGYIRADDDECGTSYSTPLVAGVAALLLSYNNNLTAAQLKQYILDGVRTSSSLSDYCSTGGYLDAYGAFLAMLGDSAHSINLQIMPQMIEVDGNDVFAYDYDVNVAYNKNYVKLSEIVFFVDDGDLKNGVNPITVSFSESNGLSNVSMTISMSRAPDSFDVPLVEFHFISYSSSVATAKSKIYVTRQKIYNFLGEQLPRTSNIYRKILMGDVNGDNIVNSTDEELVLKHSVGKTTLTGDYLVAADVNYDLAINARDTLYLQKYRNGKLLSFY